MKRILLMGNPNVGKSAVFSRLTGARVISSNYPGTTVEFTQGVMNIGEEKALLIDVPGAYDLEATSQAEAIAIGMLREGDVVINVVDATNLERGLGLTLRLLEKKTRMLVALNMWDEARHKGIAIDVAKLESALGVPVVPIVAISGEGIKALVVRIPEARAADVPERPEAVHWAEIGRIVAATQSVTHRHRTFLEALGDASVRPFAGIFIAALIMIASFGAVRFIGETLIGALCEPLFEGLWKPLMMRLSQALRPGSLLHGIVIGKLVDGDVDFVQSFGLLTTGLFVPLGMVLPYVFSFYVVLGFLEDFGYLPRLAVLLDTMMHRMGLHGWAIIPSLLGLGCNVPGILAIRILETRRERFIAATIISIGVPCAALQAMIWGLLGRHGGRYVLIVYGTLFLAWAVLGRFLNLVLKGRSPELIMEIPPYRLPSPRVLARKVWMRMAAFLREAVPVVMLGVLIVNALYFLGVFDAVAEWTAPVMTRVLGLPKEAVAAMAVGFLRKDVAVGMLGALDMTAGQLTVAVTVLAMFFPCIASFVVLWKELGWADLGRSVLLMLASSLAVGAALNAVLR
ncbi:MAG: ferrous iron transporter B [Lentisphaerae bacterium]|nr:ferrous iron transporter B [Lentisphaerota bacterium]